VQTANGFRRLRTDGIGGGKDGERAAIGQVYRGLTARRRDPSRVGEAPVRFDRVPAQQIGPPDLQLAKLSARTFCTFPREFSSVLLPGSLVHTCGGRFVPVVKSRSAHGDQAAVSIEGHVPQAADWSALTRARRATVGRDLRSAGTAPWCRRHLVRLPAANAEMGRHAVVFVDIGRDPSTDDGNCPSPKSIRPRSGVEFPVPDVALFLPFRCTKGRQIAASAVTKRKPKITGFFE